MSETEDEGESSMQLEDERKLMRSVLSQFDDGAAKAEQQDAQPPAEVDRLTMTLQRIDPALYFRYASPWR